MSKVKIEGNASGTGTLTISAPNTNTDRTINLPDDDITLGAFPDAIDVNASAPADSLNIDSNGRIGIGVTPTTQFSHNILQIGNQATLGANAGLSTTGQTYLTHNLYYDTGGTLQVYNTSSANEGAQLQMVNGELRFKNSSATTGTPTVTERMRIDSSGNVGIGRTSITYKLEVAGDIMCGQNGNTLRFGRVGQSDGAQIQCDNSSNLIFRNNGGSERMRIDNGGRVGIGKSASLEAPLEVRQTGTSQDGCIIDANNSSFSQRVLVFQSTAGSGFYLAQGRNGGGEVFRIESNGAVKNTTNSYGSLSDERVKQNIVDANSQWDDIKALQFKNYKLKKDVNADSDNAPTYLGVIAQDLEASGMNGLVDEVKPEKEDIAIHSDFGTVVEGTADNGATPIYDVDEEGNEIITGYKDKFLAGENKKEVKYSILYMKAVKALQEAMERIETLESKVEALENA